MIIESSDGTENRILPDTSATIAFRLKGQTAFSGADNYEPLPSAIFSGLRKTARLISYSSHSSMLLVIFREGGATAFFRQPLYELYDQSLALDYLVSRQEIAATEDQLLTAVTDRQRIAVAEQFFISKLEMKSNDPLVQEAIRQIKTSHGIIRVRDIHNGLHISRDPFEKRFRKQTGTSPKQFASIIRLRHLISIFPQAKSFTDAAYSAGYFDQAHFIKDFRRFTGQAPHVFFASANWW